MNLDRLRIAMALAWLEAEVLQDASQSEGGKGFTLAEHRRDSTLPLSPFYFEFGRLPAWPQPQRLTALCLLVQLGQLDRPQLIAGVPMGMVPLGAVLSYLTAIPMVIPRVERGKVDGNYHKGQGVVVFEDALSSGGSLLEVCELLEGAGLEVKATIALLDRECGGSQCVAARYPFSALWTASAFFQLALEHGRITEEDLNRYTAYMHRL